MLVFLVLGIATRYVDLGWFWSGYLLDMDKVQLRMSKNPTVERFEDQGGGERFMIESRASLQCLNPIGLAQFDPAP